VPDGNGVELGRKINKEFPPTAVKAIDYIARDLFRFWVHTANSKLGEACSRHGIKRRQQA